MAEDKEKSGKVTVHLVGNVYHDGQWHYGDAEGKQTLSMDRARAEQLRAAGTVRLAGDKPRPGTQLSHLQLTGQPNPEPEPEPDPVTGAIAPAPGEGGMERPEVGLIAGGIEPGGMAPEVAEPHPDTDEVSPAPGSGLPPPPDQPQDATRQAARQEEALPDAHRGKADSPAQQKSAQDKPKGRRGKWR